VFIENERNLLILLARTKSFRRQKHSKLESHIEPRKPCFRIDTHDRNIMDAKLALLNDGFNLGEPIFA